jgi:hypothetical protein
MDKMQAFLKRGFSGLSDRNVSHDTAHDVAIGFYAESRRPS